MAEKYLGKKGKIFAGFVYLFLFYSLLVAYVSGGGAFFQSFLGNYISLNSSVKNF